MCGHRRVRGSIHRGGEVGGDRGDGMCDERENIEMKGDSGVVTHTCNGTNQGTVPHTRRDVHKS